MKMGHFKVVILVIIFISILARSTFGFGDAVVAMPLLSMVVGLNVATPLVGLMGITTSITILIRHLKHVHFRSLLSLIVPTLIGIPIGVLLLKGVYENVMKLILAGVIISF